MTVQPWAKDLLLNKSQVAGWYTSLEAGRGRKHAIYHFSLAGNGDVT